MDRVYKKIDIEIRRLNMDLLHMDKHRRLRYLIQETDKMHPIYKICETVLMNSRHNNQTTIEKIKTFTILYVVHIRLLNEALKQNILDSNECVLAR